MQSSFTTWVFTVTTLGNSHGISPSYGATEFVISLIITCSLYYAAKEMDVS